MKLFAHVHAADGDITDVERVLDRPHADSKKYRRFSHHVHGFPFRQSDMELERFHRKTRQAEGALLGMFVPDEWCAKVRVPDPLRDASAQPGCAEIGKPCGFRGPVKSKSFEIRGTDPLDRPPHRSQG